jgi:hypothetical protein
LELKKKVTVALTLEANDLLNFEHGRVKRMEPYPKDKGEIVSEAIMRTLGRQPEPHNGTAHHAAPRPKTASKPAGKKSRAA